MVSFLYFSASLKAENSFCFAHALQLFVPVFLGSKLDISVILLWIFYSSFSTFNSLMSCKQLAHASATSQKLRIPEASKCMGSLGENAHHSGPTSRRHQYALI
ncbi:Hypothetical predicted protein [Octopus vulgaris]|uniref:Uncharacterized protein n=1 Tax=Octopus vulgaris TaxID=6645 RepID=A0AA36BT17_OCTVU|nr:Hypothetical predicted protein [Octopus vulgaris]